MELIDNVLQVSSRTDNKEKTFLDEVKFWECGTNPTDADVVPLKMVPLDRMLKPELIKACREDATLSDEIERKRKELDLDGKILTSRRILFMIYNNLSSDKSMLEICTIRNLTDIRWEDYGDENAPKFWHDFLTVLRRLDNPLSVEHRRDTLYTEMKKSEGLKIPLIKYKDTPTSERTWDMLVEIMSKWLNDTKQDRNLAAELASTKNKSGARPKQAAAKGKEGKGKECFKCGSDQHWIRDCPKNDDGKGDAGTKGKKGDQKGKQQGKEGKGKTNSGLTNAQKAEIPCAYFQTKWHGGECKNNNCPFAHSEVATQAEYDALYKPWEHRRTGSTPRAGNTPRGNTPRAGSPGGKKGDGKKGNRESPKEGKPFAEAANYSLFCRKGNECPGRAAPEGDGSCGKIHCTREEAERHIGHYKEMHKH